MIKLDTAKRNVRETKCNYIYTDAENAEHTAEIRVRYFSLTVRELKEFQARQAAADKAGEKVWSSDILAERVESLPDLGDTEGKPFTISVELFDSMDLRNVEAIQKAISEDTSPKEQPSK